MSNYRRKPQNLLKGYKADHLGYPSESKAIDGTKGGTRYSKIQRWSDLRRGLSENMRRIPLYVRRK